jgi:hypothetical protein
MTKKRRLLIPCALVCSLLPVSPRTACAAATDEPASGAVFGAGWTADSLANLEVGRFRGRTVSYRFRANHSGTVNAVWVYFIFRHVCPGCYANGDGGKVTVQIMADDGTPNHFPSSTVLASVLVADPMKQWNREVRFPQPPSFEAGKFYHIVFSNPVPDPVQNYVSVDDLYASAEKDTQPSAANSALAVLLKPDSAASWQHKPQHVPVFSVQYSDGFAQGQGYIDVKNNGLVVNEGSSVREVFTVKDADHKVSSLAVRIQPQGSQGSLKLVLEDDAHQVLQTAFLSLAGDPQGYVWKTYSFAAPLTLSKGSGYSVVLTAENGASFRISPLQKGIQYGFALETVFSDGHCETKTGPLWTGCLSRSDLDMPFYLH